MSLQRLMLRTAFVRALSNGGVAPWPTIAQGRVFDSRIGPLPNSAPDTLLPVLAIYSEEDGRELFERGSAGGRFRRHITICIEIAIGTWGSVISDNGVTEPVFGTPQSDAELEALLDMLEFQIWRAVYDITNANAIPLQSMVKEFSEWRSVPQRSADGNNKISARELTIVCFVADDCRPDIEPVPAGTGGAGATIYPPLEHQAPYLTDLLLGIASNAAYASLANTLNLLTGAVQPAEGAIFERGAVTGTIPANFDSEEAP